MVSNDRIHVSLSPSPVLERQTTFKKRGLEAGTEELPSTSQARPRYNDAAVTLSLPLSHIAEEVRISFVGTLLRSCDDDKKVNAIINQAMAECDNIAKMSLEEQATAVRMAFLRAIWKNCDDPLAVSIQKKAEEALRTTMTDQVPSTERANIGETASTIDTTDNKSKRAFTVKQSQIIKVFSADQSSAKIQLSRASEAYHKQMTFGADSTSRPPLDRLTDADIVILWRIDRYTPLRSLEINQHSLQTLSETRQLNAAMIDAGLNVLLHNNTPRKRAGGLRTSKIYLHDTLLWRLHSNTECQKLVQDYIYDPSVFQHDFIVVPVDTYKSCMLLIIVNPKAALRGADRQGSRAGKGAAYSDSESEGVFVDTKVKTLFGPCGENLLEAKGRSMTPGTLRDTFSFKPVALLFDPMDDKEGNCHDQVIRSAREYLLQAAMRRRPSDLESVKAPSFDFLPVKVSKEHNVKDPGVEVLHFFKTYFIDDMPDVALFDPSHPARKYDVEIAECDSSLLQQSATAFCHDFCYSNCYSNLLQQIATAICCT